MSIKRIWIGLVKLATSNLFGHDIVPMDLKAINRFHSFKNWIRFDCLTIFSKQRTRQANPSMRSVFSLESSRQDASFSDIFAWTPGWKEGPWYCISMERSLQCGTFTGQGKECFINSLAMYRLVFVKCYCWWGKYILMSYLRRSSSRRVPGQYFFFLKQLWIRSSSGSQDRISFSYFNKICGDFSEW